MTDPIVDEVRRIRQAHAARFHFDLHAICEDLRMKERTCGHPLVKLPAKPFPATGKSQPEGAGYVASRQA
jgi:hypothetical protein